MEFVFYPPPPAVAPANAKLLPPMVKVRFMEAHAGEAAETWKFWQKIQKPIPVFFTGGSTSPGSLGLAQMHRISANLSIHDALKNHGSAHFDSRLDLPEAMFGHVSDKIGLRGRVSFETLCATHIPDVPRSTQTTVLGSPRPSFYPNYLEQHQSDDEGRVERYNTWLNPKARLRGRKLYPVRPDKSKPTADLGKLPPPPTAEVAVHFKPLPSGSRFCGRVHVHNLRPVEIGALIWALTWGEPHREDSSYRHHIGMAKPFGFGCVRIKILGSSLRRSSDWNQKVEPSSFADDFVAWMELKVPGWKKNPQMTHLLSIADSSRTLPTGLLRYPLLDPERSVDEFRQIKNRNSGGPLALLSYPELLEHHQDVSIPAQTLASASRQSIRAPASASSPLQFEQLYEGMELSGRVKRLINSGAFIDVGIRNTDGFLHVSQIARYFVKHPGDVLSEGQQISVRVLKIDGDQRRFQLTMK